MASIRTHTIHISIDFELTRPKHSYFTRIFSFGMSKYFIFHTDQNLLSKNRLPLISGKTTHLLVNKKRSTLRLINAESSKFKSSKRNRSNSNNNNAKDCCALQYPNTNERIHVFHMLASTRISFIGSVPNLCSHFHSHSFLKTPFRHVWISSKDPLSFFVIILLWLT